MNVYWPEKPNCPETNLSQFHFVHYRSIRGSFLGGGSVYAWIWPFATIIYWLWCAEVQLRLYLLLLWEWTSASAVKSGRWSLTYCTVPTPHILLQDSLLNLTPVKLSVICLLRITSIRAHNLKLGRNCGIGDCPLQGLHLQRTTVHRLMSTSIHLTWG